MIGPFDLHVFRDRDHKPRVSVSIGMGKSAHCALSPEEHALLVQLALRALGEEEKTITKSSASSPALQPVEVS